MQLKIIETPLGGVPFYQLARLLESMDRLPINTIGYTIPPSEFVVVAGASLGTVDIDFNARIEILKSGTLTLEIQ